MKLSTGKMCPRCGFLSLEEYSPYLLPFRTGYMETHFYCVTLCGMDFGLTRLGNGKIKIGYNNENETYLRKRFNF
jgi:hypothetical protein